MEDLVDLSLHTATDLDKPKSSSEYGPKETNYTHQGTMSSAPAMLLHSEKRDQKSRSQGRFYYTGCTKSSKPCLTVRNL